MEQYLVFNVIPGNEIYVVVLDLLWSQRDVLMEGIYDYRLCLWTRKNLIQNFSSLKFYLFLATSGFESNISQ